MEAHAQLRGGGDLRRQQVAGAAWMQVQVVGRRRAAAERQLGETDERAAYTASSSIAAHSGYSDCSQPNSGLSVIGG